MQLKCGFTAFRPGLAPGIFGLLYCVDQEPNLCYVGCLLIMLLWNRLEQEEKNYNAATTLRVYFKFLLCANSAGPKLVLKNEFSHVRT